MQQYKESNLHVAGSGPIFEEETEGDGFSLIALVAVIVHYWRWVAAMVGLATAGTAWYAWSLPNVYTAKTMFLPPQQSAPNGSNAMMQGAIASMAGGDILGASRSAMLYVEMLKIEGLRDPLIDQFQLQKVYGTSSRETIYHILASVIAVSAGKEGMITVSVDDTDPKRAAGMANAMINQLKKVTTSMSMAGAGKSKAYLEDRLEKSKEELSRAEEALKAFQARYKTLDPTAQAVASAGAMTQLAAQLNSQEIQLNVLRRTHAESSQQVKSLQQSLAALKEKIARLQNQGDSVGLPGLQKIPERGQEYLDLMRRLKAAESVFESLNKQYEVAKFNSTNDVSSIQVIQPALVPEYKSGPVRTVMVLKGVFLSLLIACGLVYLFDYLRKIPAEQVEQWKSIIKNRG